MFVRSRALLQYSLIIFVQAALHLPFVTYPPCMRFHFACPWLLILLACATALRLPSVTLPQHARSCTAPALLNVLFSCTLPHCACHLLLVLRFTHCTCPLLLITQARDTALGLPWTLIIHTCASAQPCHLFTLQRFSTGQSIYSSSRDSRQACLSIHLTSVHLPWLLHGPVHPSVHLCHCHPPVHLFICHLFVHKRDSPRAYRSASSLGCCTPCLAWSSARCCGPRTLWSMTTCRPTR